MNKTIKTLCTMLLAATCTPLLQAQNPVQTVDQVTEAVVLTEAVDYVITNTTPFTTTGSIDIKHPDATVIFQNIRPSTVVSTYLRRVTADGKTLSNNGNCRVSIYLHGAMVMPHSDTRNADGTAFYPVTFYEEDNLQGESWQYNGDARQTSGPWVDKARSFTLKRGYMLTVANMANGTGYSHCYIANTKDIEVQMPAQLAGKLGFFRIFRWQWPSKKGSCDVGPDNLDATWHYNWGAGRTSGTNYEYVPQRHHEAGNSNGEGWKGAWESWENINGSDGTCTHVLGQNEPDNTGGAKEVYTYVSVIPDNPRENCATSTLTDHAAEFLYSGKRIGTFACCNPNTGWVKEYVDWCRQNNIRVDFVATHYYIGGQTPQGCIDRLWALYNVTGLPVWVTEWNNGANWSGEGGFTTDTYGWYSWGNGQDSRMNGIWLTDVLRRADRPENSWLERLAVYNAVETKREVWTNGALSAGGQLYKAYQSTFAYDDKNEYFMPWNHKNPTDLKVTAVSGTKRVNLIWTHANGKQTDSLRIERKVSGSAQWVVVKTLKMPTSTTMSYTDDLTGISGLVTYRVRNYDSDRRTRLTGEASVTVSGTNGSAALQYGSLTLSTVDETVNVTLDYPINEKPAVFTGLMTYNNANTITTPFFKSSSITKAKFGYIGIPWKLQKNSSGKTTSTDTYTKNEILPFMVVPFGNYQFGNMKAEVGQVRLKDTVDVVFAEPFPEGVTPVVIGTVNVATNDSKSIMHKIWDVTNTGFRCNVMYEDAEVRTNGQHLVPTNNHTLVYLAVTPGDGCVDAESGTYLAAGIGSLLVSGTTASDEYFIVYSKNDEGEEVGDTLRLSDPVIFAEPQTKNLPTPQLLRTRGNIVEESVDEKGDPITYTTGVKVRRIVDESVTSGINKKDGPTADQIGWIAIHTNATTPYTDVPLISESTYTGNELNISVINRIIYVEGFNDFELFTLGGVRAAANATQTPGVYIVRAGAKTAKVIVQ